MSGLFFGVMIFGPMSDKIGRVNTVEVAAIGLIGIGSEYQPMDVKFWDLQKELLSSSCSVTFLCETFVSEASLHKN